jgi:Bacterial PH domain
MIFSAKVDWWVWVLVASTVFSVLVPLATIWRGPPLNMLLGFILLGTVFVVAVLPLFNTSYVITQSHLQIKFGLMRWQIPLSEISGVRESNDLSSAPALSLRRIKVAYGNSSYILVSPTDRIGFSEALEAGRLKVNREKLQ